MSRKPISMRKVKEVLRLKSECNLSDRQIAQACNLGRTTVQEYLARARVSQISWENARNLPEDELESLLFPGNPAPNSLHPLPDWKEIHQERRKPGVTLQLLWEEYRNNNQDGYGYSRFCELYHAFVRTIDPRMRQTHKAGDKLFVDYSGRTVEIVDSATGEIRSAQLFVAVLGASNYTFIEATWSQKLQDWVASHIRAFEFFNGVPALIVPDNLKSAIHKACRYDPDENPGFSALAEHYGTAILPARPYRPRDKAKVEGAVLLAQRWVMARLRNQRFFSLSELNEAIRALLVSFNQRPFKKLPGCRQTQFEMVDKPALRPLPSSPFEMADWKRATVGIDYHVEYEKHYYSVPFKHVHQSVLVRATEHIVEIFLKGRRLAAHVRNPEHGKQSTLDEHMPPKHQFGEWSPGRFLNWANNFGPHIVQVIRGILESKPHPAQSFRACLGVLRLEKKVGAKRLDAACERALYYKSPRYKTVQGILENGQEFQPIPGSRIEQKLPVHDNIRGSSYFWADDEGEFDASATNH